MSGPFASLVLPVHDQADHIGPIVEGYLEALRRLPREVEILLVTNACRDDSVAVCERLAGAHPQVRTLDLEDGGWGRAVKAGLTEARGDVLAYTNSARTTPDMLVLAFSYAIAYPDAVLKANRRIRDSLRRRLGSVVYNFECRALFDLASWDINGTPKVFPRAYDRLLALTRDDDLIDAEFMWTCRDAGYPVVEIPILATERHGGASTTSYRSALRMYHGAVRLRRRGLQT